MAEVRDDFSVSGDPETVLAAISSGAERRGRKVAPAGQGKLAINRGIKAWSFTAKVEVEVSASAGSTNVYLKGSSFGVGPIVKQGPKREMAKIREDAEAA